MNIINLQEKDLLEMYELFKEFTEEQYFLKALNDVEKWKNYRNELIHSVLENNIDSINDTLKEKVDEGKQLINQLTELSRLVKKNSFVLVN
jgi:transcriptional regulator of heat shock response